MLEKHLTQYKKIIKYSFSVILSTAIGVWLWQQTCSNVNLNNWSIIKVAIGLFLFAILKKVFIKPFFSKLIRNKKDSIIHSLKKFPTVFLIVSCFCTIAISVFCFYLYISSEDMQNLCALFHL
jgi:hypothetical protein